ncbi:MAG: tRNA methyltransferase ppm2 [Claussenomyces sp. TS43310]|nr:MAG: tRNA methyltransferase ppm2 [Claussenomyces sp. TS43310]
MEEPTRLTRESRSSKQDESIMGTNNSSIISKRSVERLYSPNEPHFYRYFVKKPHRRAPLINRGYWLRMKAVDHVVHHFLNEVSEKKIIINLGCGYDPLPWQCLSKYPAASRGVKFIDVDYKDLMLKKRMIVQQTPELHGQLTGMKTSDSEVLLHSDPYIQLGCDLRDVSSLSRALSSVVDLETSLVLLISEVAITYINIEAANTLIGWAATLPHGEITLLEM